MCFNQHLQLILTGELVLLGFTVKQQKPEREKSFFILLQQRKASNTHFSHHNDQAKTLKPNRLLKSLMWADENNGFEDYNPQHCSFCGVTSSLERNEGRKLSLNKTAGQGSVCLSAVKIALKATGQAGLNTIKPSES